MLVVGLTGGIGSGKSTVAKLFSEYGVPIIDADVIAREVVSPNSPAFYDIIDHFNEEILLEDGTIDRKKLRKIIFNHPEERIWLEKLLHPLILNQIKNQLKNISAPYVIVVIPLLFETGPFPFIDKILVVDSQESDQINRIKKRDNITEEQIHAILKTQMKREHKINKAHDVIVNDGNLADLKPQVEKLHKKYNVNK